VSAVEKSTGKSNKITITNDKARLSREEVDRLVAEAEKYAAEDKARMEKVEARNGLESYLYNVRNTLREDKVKDKLGSDEVSSAETDIDAGLSWLSSHEDGEVEEFKEKQKEMEEKFRPLMMKLYSGGEGAPGGSDAPSQETREPEPAGPKVEEID
jgi:L1 cell adhesion molecule like protein